MTSLVWLFERTAVNRREARRRSQHPAWRLLGRRFASRGSFGTVVRVIVHKRNFNAYALMFLDDAVVDHDDDEHPRATWLERDDDRNDWLAFGNMQPDLDIRRLGWDGGRWNHAGAEELRREIEKVEQYFKFGGKP